MTDATFYYDFASPYSYLSAHRVEDVLGGEVRWQPILFGALLRAIGKVPWSWREGPAREAEKAGCVERAAALGLPLNWPPAWPRGTYSILAPRAALVAEEHGLVPELSRALYHQGLGLGRDLTDIEVVLDAADEAGLGREIVREGVQRPDIKQRLRTDTEAAVALGVTGVPTIAVDGKLFWGDDRLEAAAAQLRSTRVGRA